MNYNVEDLFGFGVEIYGECYINNYRKKDDPTITELEIPAEYNGKPVVIIGLRAFWKANYLKSVKLPKSVKKIDSIAFHCCTGLERVEISGRPKINLNAFSGCPKLPPETVIMGLVRSTDITSPIRKRDIPAIMDNPLASCDCLRQDVFELLIKNDCFRKCRLKRVFYGLIDNDKPELFQIAEQHGMLEDAELVDKLINYSAKCESAECTAYLLELKNRKFGFESLTSLEILEKDSELEELFRFVPCSKKGLGGYAIAQYLKSDDQSITELELPVEYKGKPITMICSSTFSKTEHLKRVVIPPSVRYIARSAFGDSALESVKFSDSPIKLAGFAFAECKNLERVEFGSTPPELGPRVFHGCEKLPPELLAMSMTRLKDRICREDFRGTLGSREVPDCDSLRADVFEILAKNKCYKKLNVRFLFEKMIDENRFDLLSIAGKYQMLESAALLEMLISYATERENVEATAFLLDLKNRRFGYNGGNDFEL